MKQIIIGFAFFVVCAATGWAQNAALSPQVRSFVKVSAPVIALTHVRLIDGAGAPVRADQTLIIRDGKIASIGDAADTVIPQGATVLDLTKHTIIPGLVGMHDHLFYFVGGGPYYSEQTESFPRLYLAGGVTTLRTTGAIAPYTDLEIQRAIDDGRMAGPNIHVTGPYLEGPGAFTVEMHQLKDAADATRTVDYWADEGVTSFKAYMHITPDELAAVIKAAHTRGLKVTGHLCSIGFREASALGIDNLEHGLVIDSEFVPDKQPGQCPSDAIIEKSLLTLDVGGAPIQQTIHDLVSHHVAVTSTLPVFEELVPNRPPLDLRVLSMLLPEIRIQYLTTRAEISEHAAESDWPTLFKKEMEFEKDFVKQGGLLMAGPDPTGYGGVIAGFGDQREIELLVEAGFTPVQAIQIATSNGAQFLGELDKIGTLAPGKDADIVVINGDPSQNIKDIEKVETVFKDGVGYDPARLIGPVRGAIGLR